MPGEADRLIQVASSSVLWHKERLLNIGLKHLPDDCDKLIWLDADLLFDDDNWVEETCDLLDRHKIVQPFSSAVRLPPMDAGATEGCGVPDPNAAEIPGMAKARAVNLRARSGWREPGLAWAGRREVIEGLGFYDQAVAGGGDLFMAQALWSDPNPLAAYLSAAMRQRLCDWQAKFYDRVRGEVAYGTGVVRHLWHGSLANRQHVRRLIWLAEHQFDPARDLRLNGDECWEWASDKPNLHSRIELYFRQRDEDGAGPTHRASGWDSIRRLSLRSAILALLFGRLTNSIGRSLGRKSPRLYRALCALRSSLFRTFVQDTSALAEHSCPQAPR